jgi:hypothetical protein
VYFGKRKRRVLVKGEARTAMGGSNGVASCKFFHMLNLSSRVRQEVLSEVHFV